MSVNRNFKLKQVVYMKKKHKVCQIVPVVIPLIFARYQNFISKERYSNIVLMETKFMTPIFSTIIKLWNEQVPNQSSGKEKNTPNFYPSDISLCICPTVTKLTP